MMPSAYSKATLRHRGLLDRTAAQRTEARNKGNGVRIVRAAIKRQIHDGGTTVANLLDKPPAILDSMLVVDLLRAQAQWGRQRAGKALTRLRISATRTVGSLTYAERADLVEYLDDLA